MFSSINFLFLTSLAITSWIILCYFKQIEEQRDEQLSVEINMGNNFEESLKPSCRDNYDIYLNFLCIFAAVYALAKITQVTENYIARHVHARFGRPKFTNLEQNEPKTIDDYRLQQHNLMLQIAYLEKENTQLEHRVKELQQNNFLLGIGKSLLTPQVSASNLGPSNTANANTANTNSPAIGGDANNLCNCTTPSAGVTSNGQQVYISNRHFHLTRQVYVNEGNVKLNFQDFNQEGGDFSQIWQKYLEMQKYAIQKPATPETAAEMANPVPVVISTEELQSMQGLF